MPHLREWVSPYNFVQNNPLNRIDPDGRFDWVANKEGEVYWDENATSQATTKTGETYLGKSGTGIDELWKRDTKPDAIFCFADILAIGALSGAKKLDVSVPDTLAIAGFGNDDIGKYVSPAITTMNQPSYAMGEMAASMLLSQISDDEGGGKPEEKIIRPSLVVREST